MNLKNKSFLIFETGGSIVKVTPVKLEQIWPKNTFLKNTVTTHRAPNSFIRAPIFHALPG